MFDALDARRRRIRTYRLGLLEATVPQLVPRRLRDAPADVLWKTYWRLLRSERIWTAGHAVGILPFVPGGALLSGVRIHAEPDDAGGG